MSDYIEIISTSGIESIDNCIICFYPLDKEIAQLSCGHKYHFDCLKSWTSKNKNLGNLCCICNKQDIEIQTVYNEGDSILISETNIDSNESNESNESTESNESNGSTESTNKNDTINLSRDRAYILVL